MGHLKLLYLTITTVSGVSWNVLYHTCVYSCDFSLFNNKNQMASPDLSDFLAADVWSYERQADFGLLFSAGPVFENTERAVVNRESVRLGSGPVEAAGRTTRSSASVHTPASHPGSSSYSLLNSESLCRSAQTHIRQLWHHITLQPLLYCHLLHLYHILLYSPALFLFLKKVIENIEGLVHF